MAISWIGGIRPSFKGLLDYNLHQQMRAAVDYRYDQSNPDKYYDAITPIPYPTGNAFIGSTYDIKTVTDEYKTVTEGMGSPFGVSGPTESDGSPFIPPVADTVFSYSDHTTWPKSMEYTREYLEHRRYFNKVPNERPPIVKKTARALEYELQETDETGANRNGFNSSVSLNGATTPGWNEKIISNSSLIMNMRCMDDDLVYQSPRMGYPANPTLLVDRVNASGLDNYELSSGISILFDNPFYPVLERSIISQPSSLTLEVTVVSRISILAGEINYGSLFTEETLGGTWIPLTLGSLTQLPPPDDDPNNEKFPPGYFGGMDTDSTGFTSGDIGDITFNIRISGSSPTGLEQDGDGPGNILKAHTVTTSGLDKGTTNTTTNYTISPSDFSSITDPTLYLYVDIPDYTLTTATYKTLCNEAGFDFGARLEWDISATARIKDPSTGLYTLGEYIYDYGALPAL